MGDCVSLRSGLAQAWLRVPSYYVTGFRPWRMRTWREREDKGRLLTSYQFYEWAM